VRQRVLAVENLGVGRIELRLRSAAPLDRDHGVVDPVTDRHRRQRRRQIELEAFDRRDETAEGDQARGPRAAATEPERVRHHRALREAPEDRSLGRHAGFLGKACEPLAGERIARAEGLPVREADLADEVPMRAAGWQRERPAGGCGDEPALRVEKIE